MLRLSKVTSLEYFEFFGEPCYMATLSMRFHCKYFVSIGPGMGGGMMDQPRMQGMQPQMSQQMNQDIPDFIQGNPG